jgi:hypothetical protein
MILSVHGSQSFGVRMTNDAIAWDTLIGGYRVAYDPRPALAAIEAGHGSWQELWENLHHQGDVDTASYAAVPLIASLAARSATTDWNPFALAATIEEARLDPRNPPLPPWAIASYDAAWKLLAETAHRRLPDADDDSLIASLFAVLAFSKKKPFLARAALMTEAERKDMFDEVGWA